MLTRIRWFIYGVVATMALTIMVVSRARQLRERLDARGIKKVVASYGADVIEMAGTYLRNSVPLDDQAPNG
jgi:hypothetical protein